MRKLHLIGLLALLFAFMALTPATFAVDPKESHGTALQPSGVSGGTEEGKSFNDKGVQKSIEQSAEEKKNLFSDGGEDPVPEEASEKKPMKKSSKLFGDKKNDDEIHDVVSPVETTGVQGGTDEGKSVSDEEVKGAVKASENEKQELFTEGKDKTEAASVTDEQDAIVPEDEDCTKE